MNGKYRYAWFLTAPHCVPRSGFSSRRDLAEKAAKAAASKIRSRINRLETYCKKMQAVSSKYREDWATKKMRRVAEIKSGICIEVVRIKRGEVMKEPLEQASTI